MANTNPTYIFHTIDGKKKVEVLRAEAPPKESGGTAIWEVVDRPNKTGITVFRGRQPVRVDLPVMFDAWAEGKSVEPRIQTLKDMASPPAAHTPPVKIKVDGAYPSRYLTWVIDGIDWGDMILYSKIGTAVVRVRQDAVVHLLQHVSAELVHTSKQTSKGAAPLFTPYKVKAGDTLSKIAAQVYHDRDKWTVIAKYNNIRDPNKLTKDQTIKIPKITSGSTKA